MSEFYHVQAVTIASLNMHDILDINNTNMFAVFSGEDAGNGQRDTWEEQCGWFKWC